MHQSPIFVALFLIFGLAACDAAPAHTMTEEEKKQAASLTGYWASTEDDVGFSGMLNADGTALIVCGQPLETIKGPWWIASSPLRLVLQREDKRTVEFKIVEAAGKNMKLQAVSGGQAFNVQKATVVGPR